jgi:uncharacterized membrane protein
MTLLDKVNIRSILALVFSGGFFGVLFVYAFMPSYAPPEMVLGALIAVLTLVTQFYFRKAQSKESEPDSVLSKTKLRNLEK